VIDTPSTANEEIAAAAEVLLERSVAAPIYGLLEQFAVGRALSDVWLVLRAPVSGLQVFRRARWVAPVEAVAALAGRPAGLYADPPVDHATSRGIAALCDAEFRAACAGAQASEDPASGLETPHALSAALARTTARAARYDWSATAVLLTTVGDAPDAHRWEALVGALRVALRAGDEAGVAGVGTALAILPNAGRDAVRPFVARVRAALSAAGGEGVDLLAATASTPEETVDPLELRRLARDRLSALLEAAPLESGPASGEPSGETKVAPPAPRPGADPAAMWALEVDLRMIPGVRCVGVGPQPEQATGIALSVVVDEVTEPLHRAIGEVVETNLPAASVDVVSLRAAGYGAPAGQGGRRPMAAADHNGGGADGSSVPRPAPSTHASVFGKATVTPSAAPARDGTENGAPARDAARPATGPRSQPATTPLLSATAPGAGRPDGPGEADRVSLLRATFDPGRGMSEVSVSLGAARGTGRAPAGPLAGGAQATLTAIAAIGIEVPFYLVSAERARGVPGEPVVVVLAPRRSASSAVLGADERMGVAAGDDDVEAASRATLGALNRHLAQRIPST